MRTDPVDLAHEEEQGRDTGVRLLRRARRGGADGGDRVTAAARALALRLEETTALDGPVKTLEPHVRALFGSGTRGSVLRGDWLGHAIHPALTDLVLGSWASASLLDVLGRGRWAAPAQSLVGTGLLAFGPTAWTGWAEWSTAGAREKRVGVVHVGLNAVAAVTYFASWAARRKGRHSTGARLALLGAGVSAAAGFLGEHLAEVRKVGSHHPAFAQGQELDDVWG